MIMIGRMQKFRRWNIKNTKKSNYQIYHQLCGHKPIVNRFFNKEKAEKFEKLFSSISFENILLSHY